MKYHLPLILFDPDCPLCVRFKHGLEFFDKNLNFISVKDEEIYLEFPELSRQECLKQVHMITGEKKILKGKEVVDELITSLPAVSKLAWLLDNEQGQKVKDFFYNKVEELREITNKKNEGSCNKCPHEKV